jgi:hypothetical protein
VHKMIFNLTFVSIMHTAGMEGFEPSNADIKNQRLNPLGDIPNFRLR